MATPFALDELIDRLTWTSEALLEAAQDPSLRGASPLLDERAGQLALLKQYGEKDRLQLTRTSKADGRYQIDTARRVLFQCSKAVIREKAALR